MYIEIHTFSFFLWHPLTSDANPQWANGSSMIKFGQLVINSSTAQNRYIFARHHMAGCPPRKQRR